MWEASWADNVATLVVYPSISGVSPTVGSVEGGQLITMLGSRFSKELTDNIITVNGGPCTAKKFPDSGIVCMTSAVSPATVLGVPVKPVWQQGRMAVDHAGINWNEFGMLNVGHPGRCSQAR